MTLSGPADPKEKALWKWGIISPLLLKENLNQTLNQELQLLSQKVFITPQGECKQYSANTFKDWLYLYRKFGIEGLMGKYRNDKGSTAIPPKLQERFKQLRKEFPGRTTKRILKTMRISGIWDGNKPSAISFYRFAEKNNLKRNPVISPHSVSPFEFEAFGDMWMADYMHGPKLAKGIQRQKTYLHAIIDDTTRYIVQAKFHLAEDTEALISDLMLGVRRFGIPLRFYTDNGAAFKSLHLKQVAAKLGIHLPHTPAYKPQGRGKIERFFRTVRDQFSSGLQPRTLEQLNEHFGLWLSEYHETVHSALGVSPLNCRLMKSNALKQLSPIQNADALFRMEIEKKIGSNGCVRLKNKMYEIKHGLPGQKIKVYYIPWNMSVIYYGEEMFPATELDKLKNSNRFNGPKRGKKENP